MGIIGISERLNFTEKPKFQVFSERETHLHLFNTFSEEKENNFSFYKVLESKRSYFIKREIIFAEKENNFNKYEVYNSFKKNIFTSYLLGYSERTTRFLKYEISFSERKMLCSSIGEEFSEKENIFSSTPSSFRFIILKAWHMSERGNNVFGIPQRRWGDQRTSFVQVDSSRLVSIRENFIDSCSIAFSFKTSENYPVSFSFQINKTGEYLFEDCEVASSELKFDIFSVKKELENRDLILMKDKDNSLKYLARNSLNFCITEFITENTKNFKGFLIPFKTPLYLRIVFKLKNLEGYESPQEYYNYLRSHGYFKLTVNNQNMDELDNLVLTVPENTLIPFELNLHKEQFILKNNSFWVYWGYPYVATQTFKTQLIFL